MRVMVMHKVDAKMEAGAPPDKKIVADMGRLCQRYAKAGVFKDGAGLHRSALRARVSFAGNKPAVTRGPYPGDSELLAHFALIAASTIEHAIELATELGEASGRRAVEVGPVVETWDLFGGKRPADAPVRFLLLVKADAAFEAGAPQPAAVAALVEQWRKTGVLQSATTLAPSKQGLRLSSKRRWIDGPFTESKELIAGFSILEVASLDEARTFTEEYQDVLGDNEVDVRVLV